MSICECGFPERDAHTLEVLFPRFTEAPDDKGYIFTVIAFSEGKQEGMGFRLYYCPNCGKELK